MKKTFFTFILSCLFFASQSYSQSTLHYWNFNNSSTESDLLTATSSLVSGASITHVQGGSSAIQITSNTDQGFDVTNPNAKNGDAYGTHLRFNLPIGAALVYALPTTGYEHIEVNYGTRRSGSGAGTQIISYTTDGSNYNTFDTIFPIDGNPGLVNLDFSNIVSVNNNANFKIKITFEAGAGGTGGNNRFDNFSAEGDVIISSSVIHYWNFNNSSTESDLLTATSSLVSGASITHVQGGSSAIQITSNTDQGFDVTNPNAKNGDAYGTHLRFNLPIGAALVYALPTTGYENIEVNYGTRRSGSGAGTQIISFTTDGTNYTIFDTIFPIDGNPGLVNLDFSNIASVNNNANFKIKITFEAGAGGTGGNNRFDNFSAEGDVIISSSVIHYWNFNNSSTESDLLTATSSLVSGASITHVQGGSSAIQITSNTDQGFDVTNPNAKNGDAYGTHLRFNLPIGAELVFALPTTGYKSLQVNYGTRRSGSGAGTQIISYTTDGTNYNTFDTIFPIDGNPGLVNLDFSNIVSVNNNANFKIKITFEAGAGGTGGNNRFDNFSAEGKSLTGIDILPPTVLFFPKNHTEFLPLTVQPTITFSEAVRLLNNVALDNNNVDTLIELRLNDSVGSLVSFDATLTGNIITIIPSALVGNQVYYLTLKSKYIEDLSDNAMTEKVAIDFKTSTIQTVFSAGDIVPVAYRMNATSTDDEIALLTLVNILPDTRINITDAKYTDNPQAQCAGGLTWTAPASGVAAGTVISIQNDAVTTNIGSLTGSGFGLSSGGDQVIVYTGTALSPNHITALSSNAWLTANISCSGSNSKLPTTLTDGTSSINTSTSTGNVSGNTVNAYYNGTQTGSISDIRNSVLNPANWIGTDAGTAPQTWPAWNFPGPPSVVSAKVLNQNTIEIIFNTDLENNSAIDINNFVGINNIVSVTRTQNGILADTLLVNYSSNFSAATSYSLLISGVKNTQNETMFGVYTFTFEYTTKIAFKEKFKVVNENDGTIKIDLNLEFPGASSVDVVLKNAPFSTTNSSDVTFTKQTLTFTGNSTSNQVISILVNDDNEAEQDEYFVLALENLVGAQLNGSEYITVYIKDNDRKAKVPTKEIELNHVQSFEPSKIDGSTCEIVVHDATSQRLFITSAIEQRLDIADFSNPENVKLFKSIDMKPYGGITSVAVKNGIVAVASPNDNEQLDGTVVFFNTDGDFIKKVTVGALPDMVTFSPDGKKVLTANEGQPSTDYKVDPEGSVSIIDISGGINSLAQANVQTLLFTAFNAQESSLLNAGVRKLKLTSTLSQDLEPEYITISEDSKIAWVALQENNAIAEINLETNTYSSIWALGTKNMATMGNGFDASDNNGTVLLSNFDIEAYYQPDGIANYEIGGNTFLVTANEGDEKEYNGLVERTTVGASTTILDPIKYPNAAILKEDFNLGRLRISNLTGDTDNDGDIDKISMLGARSFSIWNTTTKQKVYDSGDDFELFTSTDASISSLFNCDNEDNSFKSRSKAKGPEPEGVTVAKIADQVYAFVGLERVGGVMVYNITDPTNVKFVDYKNTRSLIAFEGDHAPEGIIYIAGENSPNGKHYVAVANEISGTISIFEIKNIKEPSSGIDNFGNNKQTFKVYPNPNNGDEIFFNKISNIEIFDMAGRLVYAEKGTQHVQLKGIAQGIYIVKTSEGETSRLVIK